MLKSETNPESEAKPKFNTRNPRQRFALLDLFGFRASLGFQFGFRICFGFQRSDFGFRAVSYFGTRALTVLTVMSNARLERSFNSDSIAFSIQAENYLPLC
jgi:hypothetical protein